MLRLAETMMRPMRLVATSPNDSDEELLRQLNAGQQDALGPLYSRYAPLIFSLAAQSLDRVGAEEIVQDVFLTVWRRAETFDPERGTFKSWALQIAHHRIVTELPSRSRRPRTAPNDDTFDLEALPDAKPDPGERARRSYHRGPGPAAVDQP